MDLRKLLLGTSVALIDIGLEESKLKVFNLDAVDVGRFAIFGGSLLIDLLGGLRVPREVTEIAEDLQAISLPLVAKSAVKFIPKGFPKPSPSLKPAPATVTHAVTPAVNTRVLSY